MNSESRLATFIQENGFPLLGIAEFGLTKKDALLAVQIARSEDLPILGGDVYLRSSGKIIPAYANWSTEQLEGETASEYARRGWTETEAYIMKYREAKDVELIFVLVVSR
jgi:hypothetical protein